ncbi:4797_t:CDS:2, partial [Gigaspora margarita]
MSDKSDRYVEFMEWNLEMRNSNFHVDKYSGKVGKLALNNFIPVFKMRAPKISKEFWNDLRRVECTFGCLCKG